MKHLLTFILLMISYMLCGAQAISLTIDNQTPGWLSSKINYGDQQTLQNLTVTGYLNSTDLAFIGTMMEKHNLCSKLDLTNANIVGDKNNEDNELSFHNIFNLTTYVSLRYLALPKSINAPMPHPSFKPLVAVQVDTLVYGSKICNIFNNALWGYYYSGGGGALSSPKHLILREGVDSISASACDNSVPGDDHVKIETVDFPSSLKFIGKRAFLKCSQLKHIHLPNTIGFIGEDAFRETSLLPDTLILPDSLSMYYTTSFPIKSGQTVVIPKSVIKIENTYTTYDNTFNSWTKWDYIEQNHNYNWIMRSIYPPSVSYKYKGFLKGSAVYIPEGSYANYSIDPFISAHLIELISVREIAFGEKHHNAYVGDSIYIKPIITPNNATNQNLRWQSSNPEIAVIDAKGKIKAIQFGKAIITAETEDGNHKAIFTLNIFEHITSSSIPQQLSINVSGMAKLEVKLSPLGKTDSLVIWQSDNDNIAITDENGIIKGISKGKCTITATTVDGGFTAECNVTVIQPVLSVEVSPRSTSIKVGDKTKLNARILPENADDKTVKWTSSDESILRVDDNGVITTFSGGKAKIYATSNFNTSLKDSCEITVIQSATGIMLNESAVEITVDGSLKLVATVLPENATNKNVNWSSSDLSVAMISGDGTVYGIKEGQATIMATTEDGGFSALCKVRVTNGFIPIAEILLDAIEIEGKETETHQLTAIIRPEDASNKVLIWKSSDEKVANVDNTGLIRFIRKGMTIITASATDGSGTKGECTVMVTEYSGIDSILADHNSWIKVFDLTGKQIYEGMYSEAKLKNGIYIIVCEGKALKLKIE